MICIQSYTCIGDASELQLQSKDTWRESVVYVMDQEMGYRTAVKEAKAGAEEGGIPIGACLVSKEGKILGQGHNMRVQKGSATLHVRPPSP